VGIMQGNLDLGGQLHVSGKLSLDYKYSYPFSALGAYTDGSHRVSAFYRLGEIPSIDFAIAASKQTQRLVEIRIKDTGNVSGNDGRNLLSSLVSNLKKSSVPQNAYYKVVKNDEKRELQDIDFELYKRKYSTVINHIQGAALANKNVDVRILTSKKKAKAGRSFISHFVRSGAIDSSNLKLGFVNPDVDEKPFGSFINNTFTTLESKQTVFHVTPIIKRRYNRISEIKSWKLIIKNSKGIIVKQFFNSGNPPAMVTWDWRTDRGNLIGVGKYSFFLQWKDRRNRTRRAPEQFLHVSKLIREISVEIKKDYHNTKNGLQRIDLHLGNTQQ